MRFIVQKDERYKAARNGITGVRVFQSGLWLPRARKKRRIAPKPKMLSAQGYIPLETSPVNTTSKAAAGARTLPVSKPLT